MIFSQYETVGKWMVKCEASASLLNKKRWWGQIQNFVIHKVECSNAFPIIYSVIISLSAGCAPMAHFQRWFKGWIVKSIIRVQFHSFTEQQNGETISVWDHYKFRHPFPPLSQVTEKKPEVPLNSSMLCWE